MNYIENFSNFTPHGCAIEVYERIKKEGKLNELETYLEDIYERNTPTWTDINDLLHYESNRVYIALGMRPEDATRRTIDDIVNECLSDEETYIDHEIFDKGVSIRYKDIEGKTDVWLYFINDIAELFGDEYCEITEKNEIYTW